jgi:hypothetical protein
MTIELPRLLGLKRIAKSKLKAHRGLYQANACGRRCGAT